MLSKIPTDKPGKSKKRDHPSTDGSTDVQELKKSRLKPDKAVVVDSENGSDVESDASLEIDDKIDNAIKNFFDSNKLNMVVKDSLKDFGNKLKNDLKSQFASKDEVKALAQKVDNYEKERQADKIRIANLEKLLENRHQDTEKYGRRNGVRIFGIASVAGENTNEEALKVFNSKLGLKLTEHDIGRSHRVGQPEKDGENSVTAKPRAILVKLVRHDIKEKIIKNRKLLKGSGIIVVEDLTKYRRNLL